MSITENESQDILGRSDLNDIEAILSITNEDADAIQHIVKDNADAIFTWDYSLSRPALRKLYERPRLVSGMVPPILTGRSTLTKKSKSRWISQLLLQD